MMEKAAPYVIAVGLVGFGSWISATEVRLHSFAISVAIGIIPVATGLLSIYDRAYGLTPGAPRECRSNKSSTPAFTTVYPELQPGRTIFGHWLEYNEEAATDATRRMREFLKRHLN